MRFKKIMLVAGMAMVTAAMVAPAARATGPEWYHEGNLVGEGEGKAKALHMVGSLSSTVIGGGGFISGPCEVTFEGAAWNEEGMASGKITGANIPTFCSTNVEGCFVSPAMEGFPWDLTRVTMMVTGEQGIEIQNAQFELHYIGATCPVPVSTIGAIGTMTGILGEEHNCLTFEEHADDMFTQAPLPKLTFDILGTLCDTTLTLT